jgi:hypothetical protein
MGAANCPQDPCILQRGHTAPTFSPSSLASAQGSWMQAHSQPHLPDLLLGRQTPFLQGPKGLFCLPTFVKGGRRQSIKPQMPFISL